MPTPKSSEPSMKKKVFADVIDVTTFKMGKIILNYLGGPNIITCNQILYNDIP